MFRRCISLLLAGFLTASCALPSTLSQESSENPQMVSFNRNLEEIRPDDKYRTTYEIFVYSYCDSNQDGIGDLNGIRSKLDYIQGLGFDAIWMTPVCPSDTYHKYDVNDYCEIDPSFGTLADYDALLKDCHERGIRVYFDLVLNHTSDTHPWFEKAKEEVLTLSSDQEDSLKTLHYANYYRFQNHPSDGFAQLADTGWYYEARFWNEMPDLNLANEEVRKEIENIVSFWLERGVDGFRLDAVTSYFTGNPDANTEFMNWLSDVCRRKKADSYLVAEAWTDRKSIAQLYSSGIDSIFDFPFADSEGIIRSVLNHAYTASDYVQAMIRTQEDFASANPNYIDAPFYTNHDMGRSAGYYGADPGPKTKMAYAMSLLMSGNSFVYYGEEIGMKGAGKDENKRAPMYWSKNPDNPDLCDGPKDMDAVEMKFPPLDEQMEDSYSIYRWFQEVIHVRNAFPAIARGETAEAAGISDEAIAAFIRWKDGYDPVLIVMNLRDQEKDVDLSPLREDLKLAAVLNTDENRIEKNGNTLHLPPFSIAFLTESGQ